MIRWAVFFLLFLGYWPLQSAFALEAPYKAKLSGLKDFLSGESSFLTVEALGGKYRIRLSQIDSVDGLELFQGLTKGRSYQRVGARVAATLSKTKLTLEFASRRKRLLYFEVSLSQPSEARMLHLRSNSFDCLANELTEESSNRSISSSADEMRSVKIGADLDYDFVRAHASREEAIDEVRRIINAVNVIYLNQLPISFDLRDIKVFNKSKQVYSSLDAESLIDQFGKQVSKRKSSVNLRHLFTGKDTHIQGNPGVVGAAYVGVLCRAPERTIGYTELTHPSVQALITAHELGHNLGAGHDLTTPSLMYPRASASNDSFSKFSLFEINKHLSQSGSCLKSAEPSIDVALSVRSGGSVKISSSTEHFSSEGCQFHLYAGTKRRVLKRIPKQRREILSKEIKAGALAGLSRGNVSGVPSEPVYIRASYNCSSDTIWSNVKTVKINPAARQLPRISASRFMKQLRK